MIIVLDTERINEALTSIQTILSKVTSIETKMTNFEETIIAAFALAAARLELVEAEKANLAGELKDAEAELTAKAEKLAAAEKAYNDLAVSEEAEDQEEIASQTRILAAAAPFLPPSEPTA